MNKLTLTLSAPNWKHYFCIVYKSDKARFLSHHSWEKHQDTNKQRGTETDEGKEDCPGWNQNLMFTTLGNVAFLYPYLESSAFLTYYNTGIIKLIIWGKVHSKLVLNII